MKKIDLIWKDFLNHRASTPIQYHSQSQTLTPNSNRIHHQRKKKKMDNPRFGPNIILIISCEYI